MVNPNVGSRVNCNHLLTSPADNAAGSGSKEEEERGGGAELPPPFESKGIFQKM
jgi:hypothetical protein